MAKPKKTTKASKPAKPAFRNQAEATGWAEQMAAQVKAGSRPDDDATRQAIAAARAFGQSGGGKAAGG